MKPSQVRAVERCAALRRVRVGSAAAAEAATTEQSQLLAALNAACAQKEGVAEEVEEGGSPTAGARKREWGYKAKAETRNNGGRSGRAAWGAHVAAPSERLGEVDLVARRVGTHEYGFVTRVRYQAAETRRCGAQAREARRQLRLVHPTRTPWPTPTPTQTPNLNPHPHPNPQPHPNPADPKP